MRLLIIDYCARQDLVIHILWFILGFTRRSISWFEALRCCRCSSIIGQRCPFWYQWRLFLNNISNFSDFDCELFRSQSFFKSFRFQANRCTAKPSREWSSWHHIFQSKFPLIGTLRLTFYRTSKKRKNPLLGRSIAFR